MLALLKSRFNYFGKLDDNIRMIYMYRYISLVFVSAFSLFLNETSAILSKIIMIICLSITSVILNKLYIIIKDSIRSILFLVLVETIGNIAIMIPTGGLESPYIWYSINTLLVTLNFLTIKYCIANLTIYFLCSIALPPFFIRTEGITWNNMILNHSNIILGLLLATIVAALLLRTQKELKRKRSNLVSANQELYSLNIHLNELINHSISLYQAAYALSNESNISKIIELLLSYAKSMMRPELAFFCELQNFNTWNVIVNEPGDTDLKRKLSLLMDENHTEIINSNCSLDFQIDRMKVIVICIKSGYSTYGAIGIQVNGQGKNRSYEEYSQQLSFLAAVGAMALERVNLEKANRRFLINEEQNRIANEIHDSVCQRLFAASCSIQALQRRKKTVLLPELTQELSLIQESIQNANRELRETIYGMSWNKDGVNIFYEDISKYIDEISRLFNKQIQLQMDGNQDLLSHNLKNVLYRIICECVGNAMRHSRCNKVDVYMNINLNNTSLIISDDGVGFDVKRSITKNDGLGISNLYSLVNLYHGHINIDSFCHKGTTIKIILPNCRSEKEEAV